LRSPSFNSALAIDAVLTCDSAFFNSGGTGLSFHGTLQGASV